MRSWMEMRALQPERDLFLVRLNLGLVLRGPAPSLQSLLGEIRRYIEKNGSDLNLVFSEVSGDRLFIRKGGGP